MVRFVLVFLSIVLLSVPVGATDPSSAPITQKEFARTIINRLGWSAGLSKEETDRDYLVILGGKRHFRFEAENAFNAQTDNVTLRTFNRFGPFSGSGWLMGISQPTTVHFTVMLPIAGTYSLRGVVKGQGFVWKVGDKELRGGSPAGDFSEVELGIVTLPAGVLQMTVTIPAEGAIDAFSLVAPDFRPIQPFGGWRFREPLRARAMAEVGIALMDLYDRLPQQSDAPVRQIVAAEAAQPGAAAAPTTVAFLGPFSSRAWLRAGSRGADLVIPLQTAEAGFYTLRARVVGPVVRGDVNGVPFSVPGKPHLDMLSLGLFRLESGDNLLRLYLPPLGGVDVMELIPKNGASPAVMGVAGLVGSPDRQVSSEEALAYLTVIGDKIVVRK